MAKFNPLIVTTLGHQYMAGSMNGQTGVRFSKVVASSHVYQDGELEALTDIEDVVLKDTAPTVTVVTKLTVNVATHFDNTLLQTPLDVNTVGLYAVNAYDNTEFLYAVTTALADGGYHFDLYNGDGIETLNLNLSLAVTNSENVQVSYESGDKDYLTKDMAMDTIHSVTDPLETRAEATSEHDSLAAKASTDTANALSSANSYTDSESVRDVAKADSQYASAVSQASSQHTVAISQATSQYKDAIAHADDNLGKATSYTDSYATSYADADLVKGNSYAQAQALAATANANSYTDSTAKVSRSLATSQVSALSAAASANISSAVVAGNSYADSVATNSADSAYTKAVATAGSNANSYADAQDIKVTSAYTQAISAAITDLKGVAPEALDTLGEIATALKDNPNEIDSIISSIGTKVNQSDFDAHVNNTTIHVTADEKAAWDAKLDASAITNMAVKDDLKSLVTATALNSYAETIYTKADADSTFATKDALAANASAASAAFATKADIAKVQTGVSSALTGVKGSGASSNAPVDNNGLATMPVSHTYHAYAWDDSGSDSFTTVYPAENLITHSINWLDAPVASQYGTITLVDVTDGSQQFYGQKAYHFVWDGETQSTAAGFFFLQESTASKQMGSYEAFSVSVKGTGTFVGLWRENTEAQNNPKYTYNATLTNAWQRFGSVGRLSDNYGKGNFCVWFDTTKGPVDAYITLPKIEQNYTWSVYTPSPLEDFHRAYPSYEGTVETYAESQPTDSSVYTWKPIGPTYTYPAVTDSYAHKTLPLATAAVSGQTNPNLIANTSDALVTIDKGTSWGSVGVADYKLWYPTQNQPYTFSAYIISTSENDAHIEVYVWNTDGSHYIEGGSTIGKGQQGYSSVTVSPDHMQSVKYVTINPVTYSSAGNVGGTFYFKEVKAERGYIRTPWCPAYEDLHPNENLLLNSDFYLRNAGGSLIGMGLSVPASSLNGQFITVSCDVELDNVTSLATSGNNRAGFEMQLSNSADGSTSVYPSAWVTNPVVGSTTKTRFYNVINMADYAGTIVDNDKAGVDIGGPGNIIEGVYIQGITADAFKVGHPKVELGKRPSPWTPAPADLETNTENLIPNAPSANISTPATGEGWVNIDDTQTYRGLPVVKAYVAADYSHPYIDMISSTITMEAASQYTATFWAYGEVDKTIINCYLYFPNNTLEYHTSQGDRGFTGDGACSFTLTRGWARYWVTWTRNSTKEETTALIIGRVPRQSSWRTVYIAGPTFTEGSRPAKGWLVNPHETVNTYADQALGGTKTFTGKTYFNDVPMFNNGWAYPHIPAGSDLNNYTRAGFYECLSNADVGTTLGNRPFGDNQSFWLLVQSQDASNLDPTQNGKSYVHQTAFDYNSTRKAIRYAFWDNSRGALNWSAWTIYDPAQIAANKDAIAANSANMVKTSGDQTINGSKTFGQQPVIINSGSRVLDIKTSNATFQAIKGYTGPDGNGMGLQIGAGGLTVIGAGEAANALMNLVSAGNFSTAGPAGMASSFASMGDEDLVLTADDSVYILDSYSAGGSTGGQHRFRANWFQRYDSSLKIWVNLDSSIYYEDSRNDNQSPIWYINNHGRTLFTEFKLASTLGITQMPSGSAMPSGAFVSLVTETPWNNDTGGYPIQTAKLASGPTRPVVWIRKGVSDTTWSAWEMMTTYG